MSALQWHCDHFWAVQTGEDVADLVMRVPPPVIRGGTSVHSYLVCRRGGKQLLTRIRGPFTITTAGQDRQLGSSHAPEAGSATVHSRLKSDLLSPSMRNLPTCLSVAM